VLFFELRGSRFRGCQASVAAEVSVTAKLGCAVKHACLAAHGQRPQSMLADRREGFEYPVVYQASYQGRSKFATTFLIPASALAVRGDTTKPVLHRRVLQA